MMAERPTYSVVLEMENANFIDWAEVSVGLNALAREIASVSEAGMARPTVIISHAGEPSDGDLLRSSFEAEAPYLGQAAELVFAACAGGRYYDLKNNGVLLTEADIVVFVDSDSVAEPNWLSGLLTPFKRPETVCVNGYTYLLHDDFFSRTFALLWFFPLAEGDKKFAAKRALNANNIAFRHDWISSHPFPAHNGFKVSCTLLMHELWSEGHKIVNVDARVHHYSPRGWRFFFWRALVTGRDADRKFVELHAPGRVQRIVKSFTRWGTMSWRTLRRVVNLAPQTGMPVWQIPFAAIVGLTFYTFAFLGHFSLAVGLVRDEPEIVPDYVVHS
ncbi:glycosyltransferase [Mesorhizobium sp. B3-1-9]|uniref:glycosyltransferase n=1 Tax=Mesorhizobium sp. B3-1-9 TaxID=2589892 RepID=UPI00112C9916|nr:glycosyltransferase [Mesorhizobium sp. B3-1-9]TPI36583.1 glycosyltransferase [Mesorhizobium sp. B3-1-9]